MRCVVQVHELTRQDKMRLCIRLRGEHFSITHRTTLNSDYPPLASCSRKYAWLTVYKVLYTHMRRRGTLQSILDELVHARKICAFKVGCMRILAIKLLSKNAKLFLLFTFTLVP